MLRKICEVMPFLFYNVRAMFQYLEDRCVMFMSGLSSSLSFHLAWTRKPGLISFSSDPS